MTHRRLPLFEFVTLMAMLFATIAFSIDAMLPALPEIGAELSPANINRAQLIITSFILGMGVGTFFTGPLSDAFGRKPVLVAGTGLYIFASWLAWRTTSLELMLAARVVQGLGAAGPRVIGMAIIRDLYKGRRMAKLMSFTMLVFSLVPAIAPAIGAGIIFVFDWRAIFAAFILFSAVTTLWLMIRQPETLPPQARIPFRASYLFAACQETMRNEMFIACTLLVALIFGMLVAVLSSTQQIYDVAFGQGAAFPLWFGATAVLAAGSNLINAALVERMGMRFLITVALTGQLALSSVMVVALWGELWPEWAALPAWFLWSTSVFFMFGLTIGNLNALAMEPMGHIAGMAASIISGVSSVLSVIIAVPIGLAFDGTPLPLAFGIALCCAFGCLLIRRIARLERIAVGQEGV